MTLDAFVGDVRALGHYLRVDDSDTGQRLWADESRWLAIWVHGAVAPDGTVLRVDRVEVLWQKL